MAGIRRAWPVRLSATPAELLLALGLLAATLAISVSLGLPVSLPSGDRAAFVGVHYLYPLIGIAIWAAIIVFSRREALAATFFLALPAYALILLCHFNLKLWIPHINPALWDELYWQTDQWMRPLVDASMAIRLGLAWLIPLDSNLYMTGFIALFYLAFGYACLKRPESFRELVLAALLLQVLGTFAYMIAPALGPFVYENGVEPPATQAQESMLTSWRLNTGGGAEWIAANGGQHLTAGLAAMPSLHAGGSFLFLVYALRHARPMVLPFTLIFAFIALDAVANRWHYIIDIPAGMVLSVIATWAAVAIVNRGGEIVLGAGALPDAAGTVSEGA